MAFSGNYYPLRSNSGGLPRALAVSVAFHGLILGATASYLLPAAPPVAGALQAVLGAGPHAARPATAPASVDKPQAAMPAQPVRPSPTHPLPPPVLAVAKDGADVRPVRSEGAAPTVAPGAAGSRSEGAAEAGVPAAGERGGAPAVAPARESVSADAMRQYRLALGGEARRYKRYPRLARERGWEGMVEVTVRLGLAGASASLGRSSGFNALDEQAVEMIAQAARQTPVPEALRGKEVTFSLPVQFSLDE